MGYEPYWKRGEITKLCKEAGIGKATLSAVLHRRSGVSRDRSFKLQVLCKEVLGKDIPWKEWLFSFSSEHPAFFDKPKAVKSNRRK